MLLNKISFILAVVPTSAIYRVIVGPEVNFPLQVALFVIQLIALGIYFITK